MRRRGRRSGEGPPWLAAIGTVLFTTLFAGTVIAWIPLALTGWRLRPPLLGWEGTRWLGGVLLIAAMPFFVAFLLRFVTEGRGTPAPFAPPRRLVVGGPFRWVRNPGYVAAVALIGGQALLLGSRQVLAYAAGVALAFHLFVVLYEEPTLRRTFGAEYDAYCRRVPRWLPRRPPRVAPPAILR